MHGRSRRAQDDMAGRWGRLFMCSSLRASSSVYTSLHVGVFSTAS